MAYCVGVMLDSGRTFASGFRTNTGIDSFASFSKLRKKFSAKPRGKKMKSSMIATKDRYGVAEKSPSINTTLLSASTITGDEIFNMHNEKLGTIQDIMIDPATGSIRYAVLASDGFLGIGDRQFAIPWKSLKLDIENKCFILDIAAERLKKAPGFDKDQWPDMADTTWHSTIESWYTS